MYAVLYGPTRWVASTALYQTRSDTAGHSSDEGERGERRELPEVAKALICPVHEKGGGNKTGFLTKMDLQSW